MLMNVEYVKPLYLRDLIKTLFYGGRGEKEHQESSK